MMIYFPDGSKEMIFKEDDCWRILEERLGKDFADYMRSEGYDTSVEREWKCFEKLEKASERLEVIQKSIEPLAENNSKIGNLFKEFIKGFEKIEEDLIKARCLLEV